MAINLPIELPYLNVIGLITFASLPLASTLLSGKYKHSLVVSASFGLLLTSNYIANIYVINLFEGIKND